jgi:hypothetical protein
MSSYLYRVSRPEHEHIEFDEYDNYVVCAASPEEAVKIHPATRIGVKDCVRYEPHKENTCSVVSSVHLSTQDKKRNATTTTL